MNIKPWEELTREEQDRYLTALWEDGYSEQKIADFLQTTKGRIVRRRQTSLKLLTSGRVKKEGSIDPNRFADLLDLRDMDELEEQGVSSIAPPAPRDAGPEPESPPESPIAGCRWPLNDSTKLKPKYCSKEVVPGHDVCAEHLAVINRSIRT